MASSQKLDVVLKQGYTSGNKGGFRRVLCFVVALLLFSISCGVGSFLPPATPTATITVSAPPTATSTPIPPSLTATAAIPCRTGPTELDELVVNLQAGEKAEIVGKSPGFWVVKTADGSECWVSDQGVTVEGEVASVADVEVPPTPAPVAPVAPISVQSIGAVCTKEIVKKKTVFVNQFHLSWQDMSNNEDGFQVYRDGDLIAELPANRTDVVDEVRRNNNRTYVYWVTAYNEVGKSKSEAIALTCEGNGGGNSYPGGAPGGGIGP